MIFSRRYFLQGFVAALVAIALAPPQGLGQSNRTVRDIAKRITVQIRPSGNSGSGILLHRSGQTYFVLTAQHVIEDTQPTEEAYVVTPDQTLHLINLKATQSFPNLDAALLQFESDRDYAVATIGDATALIETDALYVSGFPQTGTAITEPTFTITKGVLTGKGQYERGYGLIYDSVTQTGMSGGPVLNGQGQLVGIHGLAEGERVQGVPVKAGLNLGIPIQPVLALLPFTLTVARTGGDRTIGDAQGGDPVTNASQIDTSPPDPLAFRTFLERYYAVLPDLIEKREAASLYAFMPIHKERFRYTDRKGQVQTYESRLVGATKFYKKSKARGERWQINYDIESVKYPEPTQAIVSHLETVDWSVWPGVIRGRARRREIYHWEYINGEWLMVQGLEEVLP